MILQISIVQQERAQSRLELDKQEAIEREDKKQMDQLVRKQRAVLSAAAVEPKVISISSFDVRKKNISFSSMAVVELNGINSFVSCKSPRLYFIINNDQNSLQ